MVFPDYWLKRPNLALTSQTRSDFDQLLAEIQAAETNPLIDYTFPAPKWQFLCYLADHREVVLHGTGDPHIQVFEPRPSQDLTEFGAQTAVYAARDGLWAMFFAILDRVRFQLTTTNACVQLFDEAGPASEPHYVFGISAPALQQQPWRAGMVYGEPAWFICCRGIRLSTNRRSGSARMRCACRNWPVWRRSNHLPGSKLPLTISPS
jgi:hypothetical protein